MVKAAAMYRHEDQPATGRFDDLVNDADELGITERVTAALVAASGRPRRQLAAWIETFRALLPQEEHA